MDKKETSSDDDIPVLGVKLCEYITYKELSNLLFRLKNKQLIYLYNPTMKRGYVYHLIFLGNDIVLNGLDPRVPDSKIQREPDTIVFKILEASENDVMQQLKKLMGREVLYPDISTWLTLLSERKDYHFDSDLISRIKLVILNALFPDNRDIIKKLKEKICNDITRLNSLDLQAEEVKYQYNMCAVNYWLTGYDQCVTYSAYNILTIILLLDTEEGRNKLKNKKCFKL